MARSLPVREAAIPRSRRLGVRNTRRLGLALKVLIAMLAVGYALFPVAYVISASLNPTNTLVNQPLIPANPSLANFQRLMSDPANPFPRWALNSVIVSGTSAVLVVALAALGAYSFSRFRYSGRRFGLLALILVQLFPNMLAVVAIFLMLQGIGTLIPAFGLNSLGGLILIYVGGGLGFNIWLMKGFFDTIPRELDESALVDGATPFESFRHIVLPLARPIIAVIGILTFIGTYGDFLLARVILKSTENYTLAVGMSLFIKGQFAKQWGVFAAGAVLGAIPIVILFLIVQRQLVGGLTKGGVKG